MGAGVYQEGWSPQSRGYQHLLTPGNSQSVIFWILYWMLSLDPRHLLFSLIPLWHKRADASNNSDLDIQWRTFGSIILFMFTIGVLRHLLCLMDGIVRLVLVRLPIDSHHCRQSSVSRQLLFRSKDICNF